MYSIDPCDKKSPDSGKKLKRVTPIESGKIASFEEKSIFLSLASRIVIPGEIVSTSKFFSSA